MLNLPPSCSNTAPFLDESVLSKRASGYFLLKYIPVFLGKVETDRDQENHFTPTCPGSLIKPGISRRGARTLEGVEDGGLELGSRHQLLFLLLTTP